MMMMEANRTGKLPNAEYRVIHPDGSIRWMEIRGGVFRDATGQPVRSIGIAMDITERKTLAKSFARAQRAHQTLSAGSIAVMRADCEDVLLKEACQVLVEQGHYHSASIGRAPGAPEGAIELVASSGIDAEWLSATGPRTRDLSHPASRPIEIAIMQNRVALERNIAELPESDWRTEALRRGFNANAAFPLKDGDGSPFGALSVYADDPEAFDDEELALLEQLAHVISFGVESLRARQTRSHLDAERLAAEQSLRLSLEAGIQAIAATVELRDGYTAGHQRRVAALAVAIGRKIGLDEHRLQGLHLGAIVHDVGKLRIPAEILSSPRVLSAPERDLIQMHAEAGYEILKQVPLPWPVAEMVWQHHERLDGSGYPRGLKGEEILLEARIIAVADVVEAMGSHRPYRAAVGIEAGLNEVRRRSGIKFDARVVETCMALFDKAEFAFADT